MMRQSHTSKKIIIILIILGLFIPLQAAEIYRWVDREGVIHLTDEPPEGIKELKSLNVPDPDPQNEKHTGKPAVSEKKSVVSIPASTETDSLHRIKNFPVVRQESKWCALATIEMVARYYGFNIDQQQVSLEADISRDQGMTLNAILKYFDRLKILKLNIEYYYGGNLESVKKLIDNQIPLIWLHHVPTPKGWVPHAAVVIGYDDVLRRMVVADSAYGREVFLPYREFIRRWYRTDNLMIIVTSKL
ncbi:MAG: C39 family peptidase [Deltaproteobacteria bacterium]|nr:C39 family peptidase [Deltaproteobacteria bacterium]